MDIKRKLKKIMLMAIFCAIINGAGIALAQDGASQARPDDHMNQSGQTMQQAEKQAEQAAANASQHTGQMSWSEAARQNHNASRENSGGHNGQYNPALQGSPSTGYAGTWTDPATGDIITSVIAPTPQHGQAQNWPIIVEPQVSPNWGYGDYGNDSSSWQSGWNQWPSYSDPGYGPPSYPGAMPPQPNMPGNGFAPQPSFPNPPFHPGYRPLRPNNQPPFQQGWNNNYPGNNWNHNQPGWRPPQGSNPDPGRPPQNNGGLWKPGTQPWPSEPGPRPQGPGYPQNNTPPGWKPLPMTPSGQTWGASQPQLPLRPGGQTWGGNQPQSPSDMFGTPGMVRPRGGF